MVRKNFLNSLMNIRNELAKSISTQNDVLKAFVDTTVDDVKDSLVNYLHGVGGKCTIVDPEGIFTVLLSESDSIINNAVEMTIITSENQVSSLITDASQLSDVVSEMQETGVLYLSDIMTKINDGAIVNQAIAEVNDTILNNGHITISQVQTLLSKYRNAAGDYIEQIQGYISQYGDSINYMQWSAILEGIYKGGKQCTEEGSLIMDDSQPGVLQGFIASVVLEGLYSIVSTAAVLLAKFTYGLSLVLSFIVSFIFGRLDAQTEYGVDFESPTDYVNYPIRAITLNNTFNVKDFPITNDSQALVISSAGKETYMWVRDNKTLINSFVRYGMDPDLFVDKFLYSDMGGVHSISVFKDDPSPSATGDLSMSDNDYLSGLSDKDKINRSLTAALLYNFISKFKNYGITSDNKFVGFHFSGISSATSTPAWSNISAPTSPISESSLINDFIKKMVVNLWGFGISSTCYASEGQISNILAWFRAIDEQWLGTGVEVTFTDGNFVTIQEDLSGTRTYTNGVRYSLAPLDDNEILSIRYGKYSYGDSYGIGEYSVLGYTDTIPQSRLLSLPSVDEASLKFSMAIAAVSTLAVIAGATIISKAVKKRVFKNKVKQVDKLRDAKKNYDLNRSEENLETLWKEQKKYNFKAKLFGWEKYDVTNDWFESNNSNPSALDSFNSIPGIDEIKKLIR